MIGAILGIALLIFWYKILPRPIENSVEDLNIVSFTEIKEFYQDYKKVAFAYPIYQVIYPFVVFLLWGFWLFYLLGQIRSNITENFEANLVGFLFFQSMALNMAFATGLYEYLFKIYGNDKKSLNKYFGWPGTRFPPKKYYRYVIGDNVRNYGLYKISIVVIYYLIVHSLILYFWG